MCDVASRRNHLAGSTADDERLADRIATHAARERFIDRDHERSRDSITRLEITSFDDRDADCAEITGADDTDSGGVQPRPERLSRDLKVPVHGSIHRDVDVDSGRLNTAQ